MKSRSLKSQIATTFIILLSLSMFMLSCVWVMLCKKALIEKEIVLLGSYADSLAQDLRGGVACYRVQSGEVIEISGSDSCQPTGEAIQQVEQGSGRGEKKISYSGTRWAVLTLSHKNLIVTRQVFSKNGDLSGSIVIETSLESIYKKVRNDWKIVIFYLLMNVIIFSAIGFFRMFKLVLKPIDRLVDISEKFSPGTGVPFFSGNSDSEFSKLSLGLNLMLSRIREDNKALSGTVKKLEAANKELKRNESEMIRTEKLASVGRLSAGLAHEIGNPLGIIRGYVDMLGTAELNDQERIQFSKRANSELQRIDALIHQLLDISCKVDGVTTTTHVQPLLREVMEFFSLQKKNREIQITADFKAAEDSVAAHEDQLRQVFLNCLMNAEDAVEEDVKKDSADGQGRIEIFCDNSVVNGEECIQIRIVDNGTGVEDAHINNIFDPFFTTKETGKGTGLGLYVSYTIMESLGGSIRLNNCQPAGAEVVIHLPCIKPKNVVS